MIFFPSKEKFDNVKVPKKTSVKKIGVYRTKGGYFYRRYKNGKVKIVKGDSYIMLVRFGEGFPEIETVLPYGISNDSTSIHYTDQMKMYVNHERKKMTLNKAEIYNNSSNIYHPK